MNQIADNITWYIHTLYTYTPGVYIAKLQLNQEMTMDRYSRLHSNHARDPFGLFHRMFSLEFSVICFTHRCSKPKHIQLQIFFLPFRKTLRIFQILHYIPMVDSHSQSLCVYTLSGEMRCLVCGDEILDFNVECSVVFHMVVLVWMLKMCLSRAKYMRAE